MTVQMHWVVGEELVLDDEVDPFVLGLQHDRVADERVVGGSIDTLGKRQQGRLCVVDVNGAIVQEPAEDDAVVRGGNVGNIARGHCGGRACEC